MNIFIKTNLQTFGFLSVIPILNACNSAPSQLGVQQGATTALQPISQLAFFRQPTFHGTAGQALSIQPVVLLLNASGQVVPDSSTLITLTGYSDAACNTPVTHGLSTLSSTYSNPSLTTTSGVASFTRVTALNTHVKYIGASDGKHTACSIIPLHIFPGEVSQLAFTTQPSTTESVGKRLTTQPVVTLQDAYQNTVTSADAAITLSGYSDSKCQNGVLDGLLPFSESNSYQLTMRGIAKFTSTTPYARVQYLGASDGTHFICSTGPISYESFPTPPAIPSPTPSSSPTPSLASQLVLSFQPNGRTAGTPFNQQVYIQDANGNLITTGPDSTATLTLTSNSGTLSGTTTTTASGGVASFSGLSLSPSGNYTLTATKSATAGGVGILRQTGNSFSLNPVNQPGLFLSLPHINNTTLSPFFSNQGSSPLSFILGENHSTLESDTASFSKIFAQMNATGERFVRLSAGSLPQTAATGQLDTSSTSVLLTQWDPILTAADQYGIALIIDMDVWKNWNDNSTMEGIWSQNPFNKTQHGPCNTPLDLFITQSTCQFTWLQYMSQLIKHWSAHPSIVAWELFSEIDKAQYQGSGSTDNMTASFIAAAQPVIRNADPLQRPITASLSGGVTLDLLTASAPRDGFWTQTLSSPALDFIQIHPYTDDIKTHSDYGNLDSQILTIVPLLRTAFHKPIMIGESGVSMFTPPIASNAFLGTQNAIWAEAVTGVMNGRALGYEDFTTSSISPSYNNVAVPIVNFVKGVDYTDFAPIPISLTSGITGAMIGNNLASANGVMLGWFRNLTCIYQNNWPQNQITDQSVTVTSIVGRTWSAQFFDTSTGYPTGSPISLTPSSGQLTIPLPSPFTTSTAFKLKFVN